MPGNVFEKTEFSCFRDWEEALLKFFVNESIEFNTDHWIVAVKNNNGKTVRFCALLLSNLLDGKDDYVDACSKAYSVYESLRDVGSGVNEYDAWLRTGWVNVSRIASILNDQLKTYRSGLTIN